MLNRRNLIIGGGALTLLGCSDNQPAPLPIDYQPPLLPGWNVGFSSPNVPKSFVSYVGFPGDGEGIHYIYRAPSTLTTTLSLTFTIVANDAIVSLDSPELCGPLVRLFLWQRGDNMSGQGVYETYRLWSVANVADPKDGNYSVSANPQDPTQWTDVFGKQPTLAQLQANLANLYAVGFTLGGEFAGHGQDIKAGGVGGLSVDSFTGDAVL